MEEVMFSFSKPTPVGEVLSDEDDDDIVGVPARRISMGSIGSLGRSLTTGSTFEDVRISGSRDSSSGDSGGGGSSKRKHVDELDEHDVEEVKSRSKQKPSPLCIDVGARDSVEDEEPEEGEIPDTPTEEPAAIDRQPPRKRSRGDGDVSDGDGGGSSIEVNPNVLAWKLPPTLSKMAPSGNRGRGAIGDHSYARRGGGSRDGMERINRGYARPQSANVSSSAGRSNNRSNGGRSHHQDHTNHITARGVSSSSSSRQDRRGARNGGSDGRGGGPRLTTPRPVVGPGLKAIPSLTPN
eukprot:gene7994-4889_t